MDIPTQVNGTCLVNTSFCVIDADGFVVPFDSGVHPHYLRQVMVELAIVPNDGADVWKRYLLSSSPAWVKFTRPSLERLGVGVRELHGAYVRAEIVPIGLEHDGIRQPPATTFVFNHIRN